MHLETKLLTKRICQKLDEFSACIFSITLFLSVIRFWVIFLLGKNKRNASEEGEIFLMIRYNFNRGLCSICGRNVNGTKCWVTNQTYFGCMFIVVDSRVNSPVSKALSWCWPKVIRTFVKLLDQKFPLLKWLNQILAFEFKYSVDRFNRC